MGIRSKVFLALGVFSLLFGPLFYIIASKTILRGFSEIESKYAEENIHRVEDALRQRIEEIDTKLSDWAQWDDSYAFIDDHNSEYVVSNLKPQALELLKLDVMLFFDLDRQLVVENHSEGSIGKESLPEGLENVFREHPDLLDFTNPRESRSGVLMLPRGPFLLSIRPIVTSDGSGPIRGTIVFGQFLDEAMVSRLSSLTHLSASFYGVNDPRMTDFMRETAERLLGGERIIAHPHNENEIGSHVVLPDIFGDPVLFVDVVTPRDIFHQGLRSLSLLMIFGGILGAVFIIAILILSERVVLSKIVRLSDIVRTLQEKGMASIQEITLPGKDEFSSLAGAMNNLLKTVQASEDGLRHQTEELRKFELAVEYNFDHIIITDPDGVILYANPAVKRVTGFDPDEIIGKTPALWGGQMGKDFYARFWKTIKEDRTPFIGELTNRKKTGEQYLAEARVIPILDSEQKRIRFFVGLERDITARRNYERNLLMSNQLIAEEKDRSESILRFLRSIGDGIFAVDRDRKIIFMNAAAERLTKKSFEEVKDLEPKDALPFFLDTDPPTQCPCPLEMVIDSGEELLFPENLFLWGDEETKISVSGKASPIRNKDGTVVGCIVVFRDVTEKRELDQMKDRFLSVAAHQLRTPLGSMRWNMEMLLSDDYGKLPKDASDAVGDLYANSQRLVTIVNDLLDVSRIDQHKVGEIPEPTDILSIIRDAARTLSPDAEQRGIKVVLPAVESFRNVSVSPKRFYEAVENLLSNAIKYNRQGGTVDVSLEEDGGIVRIRISDTGIGIPEADREKIFAKFFRAENAVHKETDGSGLGLSVVKSFVEEDGGTVRFESEEGVGSTFIIEFPIVRIDKIRGEECLIPPKKPKKTDS